ncbi:uncharacterized protein LOC143824499 [Paroedura picta]|uniref:uncharacterized protein LOC143824499 n=1 Tax=Paroedura picta TaxID=143630 RepID=UPI004057C871
MDTQGHQEPFYLSQLARWEAYIQMLKFHFLANNIMEQDAQRNKFLGDFGFAKFEITRDLIAPTSLETITFTNLISRLDAYLSPKPSIIASGHAFYKFVHREGETVAVLMVSCRKPCSSVISTTLRNTAASEMSTQSAASLPRETPNIKIVLKEALLAAATAWDTREMCGHSPHDQHRWQAMAVHHGAISSPETSKDNEEVDQVQTFHAVSLWYMPSPTLPAVEANMHATQASSGKPPGVQEERHIVKVCHPMGTTGHLGPSGSPNISALDCKKKGGNCQLHYHQQHAGLHIAEDQGRGHERVIPVRNGAQHRVVALSNFKHHAPVPLPKRGSATTLPTDTCKGLSEHGDPSTEHQRLPRLLQDVLQTPVVGCGLLDLEWLKPQGILIKGISRLQTTPLLDVCKEFPVVCDWSLGCYNGPLVSLTLDSQVSPIRLKARCVPFTLKLKTHAELDKLIEHGVLEPFPTSVGKCL